GEALSLTELNDRALFNAEFGIGHRGSTVPERSGVALSFRGRPSYTSLRYKTALAAVHIYGRSPMQKPNYSKYLRLYYLINNDPWLNFGRYLKCNHVA
ncbi:hypothetical protein, partial [Pseudomonas psychrophila]|uniref:hypothetical protein n=1 Tax=Pseudomonas psychrophila TaxID=122355 RepID=UPI001E57A2B7